MLALLKNTNKQEETTNERSFGFIEENMEQSFIHLAVMEQSHYRNGTFRNDQTKPTQPVQHQGHPTNASLELSSS